jgi:hypothetical protein
MTVSNVHSIQGEWHAAEVDPLTSCTEETRP